MCKVHHLIIISTMLFAGSSFARTEQDFYAAKAECMSMAGSVNTPQLENSRVGAFNRGFVDGINEGSAIVAEKNKSEIYNDCLREKGWSPDGTDINTDDSTASIGGDSGAKNNPVIDEINNIPELYSWRKFDNNKFQVAVDIDNALRSKKGWQSVSLHDRFLRVVDVTNAIYGDTPKDDENCIAKDNIGSPKDAVFQLAALRMYPDDMIKNYNFMCQSSTNKNSYGHFKKEVEEKERFIANIPSVKNIGAQSSPKTVDDY